MCITYHIVHEANDRISAASGKTVWKGLVAACCTKIYGLQAAQTLWRQDSYCRADNTDNDGTQRPASEIPTAVYRTLVSRLVIATIKRGAEMVVVVAAARRRSQSFVAVTACKTRAR